MYILEAKNTRRAVGRIRPTSDGKKTYVFFVPNDSRVPRMLIPAECVDPSALYTVFSKRQNCPCRVLLSTSGLRKVLVHCSREGVECWAHFPNRVRTLCLHRSSAYTCSELQQALGLAGEIESETKGLLIQYGIDTREFCQTVLDCLPHVTEEKPWKIPEVRRGDVFNDELKILYRRS